MPTDNLPIDNVRYATVLVREPRKVLVLCDDPADVNVWVFALKNSYQCDVKSVKDPVAMNDLSRTEMAKYQAVCLVNVTDPTSQLWATLDDYVRLGGGLVVAPGRGDVNRDKYGSEGVAGHLLPGELVQFTASRDGVGLTDYQFQHQLLAKFRDWSKEPGYARVIAGAARV